MYTKMQKKKSFPQLKDFNNYDAPIIKFSELPVGIIYHMDKVKRVNTRIGRVAFFADFHTEYSVSYSAWLPGSLVDKIQCFRSR